MTDELRALGDWFIEDQWPTPVCPACTVGTLHPVGTSVKPIEAAESRRLHSHENWEPEYISGLFYGYIQCGRPVCEEIVAVSGEMRVSVSSERGSWGDAQHVTEFLLRSAIPSLAVMPYPERCPEVVKDRVSQASRVMWLDAGAGANCLRVAIEELLTHRRIARYRVNKKGKRERLTAHARIEFLRKTHTAAAEHLMAVKWIGNAGSHSGQEISIDDVLDGADQLARAIELIYDTRIKKLTGNARKINRRRGPARQPTA